MGFERQKAETGKQAAHCSCVSHPFGKKRSMAHMSRSMVESSMGSATSSIRMTIRSTAKLMMVSSIPERTMASNTLPSDLAIMKTVSQIITATSLRTVYVT